MSPESGGVAAPARLMALTFLATGVTFISAGIQRLVCRHAASLGLLKTNFEGKPIAASVGVAIWAAVVPGYLFAAILFPSYRQLALTFAMISFAVGLLGLLDDRHGSRSVGGFRGHFSELLRGRITTGAVKALLIPPIAFTAALLILRQPAVKAILTMAIVALSANALNLLDVRPARACNAWIAGCLALFVISADAPLWPLGLALGPVLVYWPVDAARRGMLGDVGANLIGAILGLQIATAAPVWARAAAVPLLLLLHVYSERRSLSAAIDASPWLRWLDWGTGTVRT